MNRKRTLVSLCSFLCVGTGVPARMLAQADDATQAPKILSTIREVTKPGKEGAAHERTEAAFVRALSAGKGKMHYIALTAMTGQPRALFMSGYPSFDALEQERKSVGPALETALDQANQADGELLSETSSAVWMRRDDISENTAGMPVGTRYLEVEQITVKPGHRMQFEQLAKMFTENYKKSDPDAHWTAYQMVFGNTPATPGPVYLILSSHKSLGEIDTAMMNSRRFAESMGEDGMKKMAELEADCLQGQLVNIFLVNPKMSTPPEAMAKAEPGFWNVKPAGATMAAAKKPASNTVVASEKRPGGQ